MTIFLCLIGVIAVIAALVLTSREVTGLVPVDLSRMLHAVSLVLIALAATTPGLWYRSEAYLGDLWTAFEAMHKTAQGLRSSIDYFNPLGPTMQWIYAVVLLLREPGATALLGANALVGGVALSLCLVLLRDRAGALTIAAAGLIAVTTALSPRDLDSLITAAQSSFLAPYNRWAWALLVPLALHGSLGEERACRRTAPLAGAALMALLLLKVTYGIVAVGLYLMAGLLRPAQRSEAAIVLVTSVGLMLLADLLTQGQVRAYWGDVMLTATMPSNGVRLAKLISELPVQIAAAGLCAIILLGAGRAAGEAPAAILRQNWRALIQTAALGGGGMLIIMQNHYASEATTLLLMPLVIAQECGLMGRAGPAGTRPAPAGAEWRALVLLLVLALPVIDAGFIATQLVQVRRKASLPALADSELAAVVFDDDYVPAPGASCSSGTCSDVRRLLAGQALLRARCPALPGQAILTLSFSNPFPSLLGRPSPSASPIWLHLNRSFSTASHVPAERLFAGVGCVMVARDEPNAAVLAGIYRDTLARRFHLVATDPQWLLYAARP